MLDTFDPRDVVGALWPALPIIALFGSMLIGCLVTRNWAAPRVRRRRLQARLADLADHREGKHLLATVRAPRLVVGDVRTGWFRDADDRQVNLLRSPSGRVPAHVGTCVTRAETLIRHLEQAGVDESLVDEARRLHRHLVGVHAEVSR